MRYITKHNILLSLAVLGMIMWELVLFEELVAKPQPTDCHDYTLNQYEAGDVPVKCINQFLEENE